jgi:hypothetical protein
MAYNVYEAASNILNLKGQWDEADEQTKKKIAQAAQPYYQSLINNGYGNVANNLQKSNAAQAQSVVAGLNKAGKTPGRDYIKGVLTGKYGMTGAEADKALTWDNDTGEVYLGGIPIGRGDALIDGTNYYSDAGTLDKGLEKYVNATGKVLNPEIRYDEGKTSFTNKFDTFFDAIGENPFESAQGRSILDYYGQLGEQAGYNQLATGAGANGGNIDSYSQANAIRQNAALRSQGEQAAINAFNSQMNNYYGALGLLQNDNQQTFDNGETAKNNQMMRYEMEAGITDFVPEALAYSDNGYFTNGSLGNVFYSKEFDAAGGFQGIIDQQKEILRTSTDPKVRETAEKTIQDATEARAYKILNNSNYGKYAGTMQTAPAQQSAAGKTADALRANERYALDTQAAVDKYASDNALIASQGGDSTNLAIAAMEAKLQTELAKMSSPVDQIQAILNSGLPQEYKDATLAGMFGSDGSVGIAEAEEADLKDLRMEYYELSPAMDEAERIYTELLIYETARSLMSEEDAADPKKVQALLKTYRFTPEDAKRIAGR